MKQMLDKIGFKRPIKNCQVLPAQKSNRTYDIDVLLESFITSIWCGANRFLHTEVKALGKIFDWSSVPGQDAYKRYFGKFTQSTNQSVGHHFFSWFFQNLQINYFTLDIDSSVITRYGEQEGQKRLQSEEKRVKIALSHYCFCQ